MLTYLMRKTGSQAQSQAQEAEHKVEHQDEHAKPKANRRNFLQLLPLRRYDRPRQCNFLLDRTHRINKIMT